MNVRYAATEDVYKWPEFQAFAGRLGVDLALPTVELVIRLAEGEFVQVTHRYVGVDEGRPSYRSQ